MLKRSRLVTDERHSLRLTPDRLVLNTIAKRQFESIGALILSSFKATEQILVKSKNREFPSDLSSFIVNSLEAGMRKVDKKTLGERQGQLPLFFRSDCVLASTEQDYRIMLTEIEGERSIGFGFASFVDQINMSLNSIGSVQLKSGLGICKGVQKSLIGTPFEDQKLGLILSEDQLFYLAEQSLFVEELIGLGVPIELIQERQVEVQSKDSLQIILPLGRRTNTAVSLPIFNPVKSGRFIESEQLRLGFIQGKFNFLLPPKKFFGTKSTLALMKQPLIKELFVEQGVDKKAIETFIPPTRIIAGQISEVERLTLAMGLQTDPPTLIKAVGMTAGRGMVMPGNKGEMTRFVNNVVSKPDNRFEFITQQFLKTPAVSFRILDPETRMTILEPQFMRLGAFFANIHGRATLLGVVGTGLDNVFVHGNPKCIQFPVVFKEDQ